MAPRRILSLFSRHSLLMYFLGIIILSTLIISCGTTRKVKDTTQNTPGSNAPSENASTESSQNFIALLDANRSKLSDVYAAQKNKIPKEFLAKSNARNIGDPNKGFRIQILSTRNVAEADSVANDFRFWVDSTAVGYVPKAYVFFNQPYYKVRIGNFQFHDQAMKLNTILKVRYPGAWVVNDAVDPDLVPPDTLQFNSKKTNL